MTLSPIDCRALVGSARWRTVSTEGGCEIWDGATNDRGYGQVSLRHRVVYAHRVAWVASTGETIPPGMQVGHMCHDEAECTSGEDCPHRRCVTPEHLVLQSPRENMVAGNAGTRELLAREFCSRGHRLVESPYPGRARSCRECVREANRERARKVSLAARRLELTNADYVRIYGQSGRTAEAVLRGLESS